LFCVAATMLAFLFCAKAQAQHLWWILEGQKEATCLYGEITVLATHPSIYYCGANWHPGEPAGGYCGIQHNDEREHRTIFSIWDTSKSLHPRVTEADAKTIFTRFGGEGEGGHTHMIWNWKLGHKFQFFVQKQAGAKGTTDTRYYIYDDANQQWIHSATITSPNGGKNSVTTIGGGMNSFLENFAGKDRNAPKLALYRLWLGESIASMRFLTRSGGDGIWGQLHESYFLAEGSKAELNAVFAKLEKTCGKPVFGNEGGKLEPLSDKPVPPKVAEALQNLPRAGKVKDGKP
jgi:hypothetical protein